MTDISCGVVYKATLASLVLFRSYCYVIRVLRLLRSGQEMRIVEDGSGEAPMDKTAKERSQVAWPILESKVR